MQNWEYLWKDNVLADALPTKLENSTIDLLIGNDYYLDLILPQKVEIQPGLYMLGSKLGWILAGRTSDTVKTTEEQSLLVVTYGNEIERNTTVFTKTDAALPTKPTLEDFWRLESIGIHDTPRDPEEKIVWKQFNEALQYNNGRYNVAWPWKEGEVELPENHGLALGRLKSLVNRLGSNPALAKQYGDIIDDQLNKGIIEKVPNTASSFKKHYIPHHAVVNPTKTTTKVRIVYDASAKTRKENNSLNECLHKGPVLLHDLAGILLRFRLYKVAIVSDIEKAFLQVGLTEESRDVTRFLWLKNRNTLKLENNIQEYRFCRVPFGIISSPFLLAATLKCHLEKCDCSTAENIRKNIYVDNVITRCDSVNESVQFYTEAKQIFHRAGMNLRDWATNSKQVLNRIHHEDQSNAERMKVLGLTWIVDKDTMSINVCSATNTHSRLTKRSVLKEIASAFDPLGLYSPVILRGKIFLQMLWNKNMSWDETLSSQDVAQWYEIEEDLKRLPSSTFDRYIGIQHTGKCTYQLLVFCDASKYAYAATVYLHQSCGNMRKVDLLFSKTRLAPKKQLSIPRLELLAALIGMRCLNFVQKELNMDIVSKHIWLDSQCVLCWIESKKSLNTFVANRVKEIKEQTDVQFHYIPTQQNPADIASRGTSTVQLQTNKLWWHGPDWLLKPTDEWPVWNFNKESESLLTETETEVKKSNVMYEAKLVAADGSTRQHVEKCISGAPYGIDITRFSSFAKLLRVTALVKRFIEKMKKLRTRNNGSLEAAEIHVAKQRWIAYIQSEHYNDIIQSIKEMKTNKCKDKLDLYLDKQGLLRCGGRLGNADLSEGARHPLLLPKQNKLTDIIVEHCHKKMLHAGVSRTLGTVRQTYWISHGRSVVKRVLRKCKVCQRHEGGPYKMPMMPPLPTSRVSESVPFTHTGIDYFGPLFIRNKTESQKVWVCLFTCLVTRAIHLELIQNMSIEQFLLGFRRFLSRHGKPKEIVSDNALHFKLASVTLNEVWSQVVTQPEVTTYIANEGIQWKYIVEFAPWMGGFYERMVGLVKRTLRKAIGKASLGNEHLLTVLKEAEAVVYSRPLVYIADDIQSPITLTPAHF